MDISGKTRMICLLGSPVEHSLSPAMQNAAFRILGLDYTYLAFEVQKHELRDVVNCFRTLKVRGMNLTMPLKNAVLPYCDRLSKAAELSGSVNTIVFEADGSISGHTTDGAGLFDALQADGIDPAGKKMVILGSGGAGTSIIVEAALRGVKEISIFCRETSHFYQKTCELAKRLSDEGLSCVSVFQYDDEILKKELASAALLVNATNVGMMPEPDACLVKSAEWLPDGLTVFDVIYNPRETKLLSMARSRGLRVYNGLGMLLWQGAGAFRLWTGKEMPVQEIRSRIFLEK